MANLTTADDGIAPEGLTASDIWQAVRKNWPMLVAVAAIVTLGTTFFSLGRTKIYRASGTVQIDPSPPRPMGNDVRSVVDIGAGTYWANKEYYETQYKIIASRRIAAKTVRTLGLHRDPAFLANSPPGSDPAPKDVTVEAAAEILRGRIQVDPEKDSRLITVSYEDADPIRAQRVLNAVVATYVQDNLDSGLSSNQSSGDWLRGQLGKLKDELENSELDLHKYKKEKNILSVSVDDQSNMLRAEMQQLNEQLTKVRTELEHLQARRTELMKVDPKDPTDVPAKELLESQLLQQLRGEYVAARRDEEGLVGSGKGANHPEVRAAASRTRATREALLAEVKTIQGSVTREWTAAKREAGGLSRLFETAKSQALNLNLLEIEYKRLERTKNNTEKLYGLVLERSKESDLAGMMHFNNIRMVDAPLIPSGPVRPNIPMSAALGLLVGLGLGIMAALGRELVDRSIKTPADLEEGMKATFLGLIPVVNQNESGYGPYGRKRRRGANKADQASMAAELIVHTHPTSAIAEAARAIRTNILFMSPDKPFRRLLVTSAAPSEGKTTFACCLATAMAQAGQRVLLVDCDLRRPRIHRIFGRKNDLGVTSFLLDGSLLDHAALETDVPNLSVLPAGPLVPNPAEIVQSETFGRLLDRLQEGYDRVVLDSPPLVPVTDAAILSSQVDGTIVVVRAFKTSREVVRHAMRTLEAVGGRVIGAVLNAVDLNRRGYDYYYHQYYYYRGDHQETSAPAAE